MNTFVVVSRRATLGFDYFCCVVNLALRAVSLPPAASGRLVAINSVRALTGPGRQLPDAVNSRSRPSAAGREWPLHCNHRRKLSRVFAALFGKDRDILVSGGFV